MFLINENKYSIIKQKNINQVCDDQWHHYAINVRFPEVELYLDGQLFRSEKKNPEVIDDWPLHPTKSINTTLTVGACWQVSIL